MIAAGSMRHSVVIEHKVAGSPQKTGSGQPAVTWTTLATVAAAIEPLSGRELFAAQQEHSEVTTRVKIRYRSDVTAKMRLSWRSRVMNIRFVLPKGQGLASELHLLCDDGVNEG